MRTHFLAPALALFLASTAFAKTVESCSEPTAHESHTVSIDESPAGKLTASMQISDMDDGDSTVMSKLPVIRVANGSNVTYSNAKKAFSLKISPSASGRKGVASFKGVDFDGRGRRVAVIQQVGPLNCR